MSEKVKWWGINMNNMRVTSFFVSWSIALNEVICTVLCREAGSSLAKYIPSHIDKVSVLFNHVLYTENTGERGESTVECAYLFLRYIHRVDRNRDFWNMDNGKYRIPEQCWCKASNNHSLGNIVHSITPLPQSEQRPHQLYIIWT